MIQKNEVSTRGENRVSLISTRRTTMQKDYPTITEGEMPVNATEQTWILEVREKTVVGRTTPKLVDTLLKIVRWLGHLGSGKIDESCLEARHNIHHNFRGKGIGL